MRTKVVYEWTLETIENGDIVDSSFSDVLNFDKAELPGNDLGLVRYEGNEDEGTTGMIWAYVKDGNLPEYFADSLGNVTGYKVPSKFNNELKRYLTTTGEGLA